MKALPLSIFVGIVIGGTVLIVLRSRSETPLRPVSQSPSASPDARNGQRSAASNNNLTGNSPTLPVRGTKIVISKTARNLKLYSGGKLLRTYPIGLGFSPVNDKINEGDGATPEGKFYIFTKNPKSAYFLSLGISYPNPAHANRGLRDGLITKEQYAQIVDANRTRGTPPQDTSLGGQIYIHGNGSHKDWTWGCVALDDKDVLELFNAVSVGTPVIIRH